MEHLKLADIATPIKMRDTVNAIITLSQETNAFAQRSRALTVKNIYNIKTPKVDQIVNFNKTEFNREALIGDHFEITCVNDTYAVFRATLEITEVTDAVYTCKIVSTYSVSPLTYNSIYAYTEFPGVGSTSEMPLQYFNRTPLIGEKFVTPWFESMMSQARYYTTCEVISIVQASVFCKILDAWDVRGEQGPRGTQGIQGPEGPAGPQGKSAYQVWLDQGNTGTEADFLESLKGPQGPAGEGGGEIPEKSVFVQGGDFTEIASGTVIKKGQVVKFVVTNYLNQTYDIYTAYGPNGEEFSLISNKSDGYDAYGWKSESSMSMPYLDSSAEVYIEVNGFSVGEYSFVYNGEDITISSVSPHHSNYINGYVGTQEKAVYEYNGEIKPLTTDMIEGNSGGGNSSGELMLMGRTTLNTYVSLPYSFSVPLNDTLTKNDLVYVEMNNGLSLIGSLYSSEEVIFNTYDTGQDVYIDKFLVSVTNDYDRAGLIYFSLIQQQYDGHIGTVKVYVQKNALTFSE